MVGGGWLLVVAGVGGWCGLVVVVGGCCGVVLVGGGGWGWVCVGVGGCWWGVCLYAFLGSAVSRVHLGVCVTYVCPCCVCQLWRHMDRSGCLGFSVTIGLRVLWVFGAFVVSSAPIVSYVLTVVLC